MRPLCAFLPQITGAIPLSVLQVVFHSDHAVYHILKGDVLCSFLTACFYCWNLTCVTLHDSRFKIILN